MTPSHIYGICLNDVSATLVMGLKGNDKEFAAEQPMLCMCGQSISWDRILISFLHREAKIWAHPVLHWALQFLDFQKYIHMNSMQTCNSVS